MGVTEGDVKRWFTYHEPNEDQLAKYAVIRNTAKSLAFVILDNTPAGADQSAAMRLLRECVMTANAAIACEEGWAGRPSLNDTHSQEEVRMPGPVSDSYDPEFGTGSKMIYLLCELTLKEAKALRFDPETMSYVVAEKLSKARDVALAREAAQVVAWWATYYKDATAPPELWSTEEYAREAVEVGDLFVSGQPVFVIPRSES